MNVGQFGVRPACRPCEAALGQGSSGVRQVRNQTRERRGNGYNRRPHHFNPEALPFREIPLSLRFCHPHSCLKTPLSYRSVYDLVRRLRQRTGIDFDPHWMRHSAATRMLRDGVPVEVVSALLGHASVTTGATVTTTSQALEGAGSPALLAKLMAAVRPEFSADPLTFAAPEERSAAASSPADPICVDGRSPDWSP